ncbi:MAG: sigma-70 family RNA polymerase sigma factor, partial [Rhodospirillaceae bacterium]|nr:sigma-70 family RNA polymerase sigma factor [Rhodospirillaceae bacterium]
PRRGEGGGKWQAGLVDAPPDQETVFGEAEEMGKRRDLLADAMQTLNDRERRILTERRLKDDPSTLEDLSKEFGVSRERVRQIEVRAFEKLQKTIRNAQIDANMGG